MSSYNIGNSKKKFDTNKSYVLTKVDNLYHDIFLEVCEKLVFSNKLNASLIVYDSVIIKMLNGIRIDQTELRLLIEKTYQEYINDAKGKWTRLDSGISRNSFFDQFKSTDDFVISSIDIYKNIMPILYYYSHAMFSFPNGEFTVEDVLPISIDYMQQLIDFLILVSKKNNVIGELNLAQFDTLLKSISPDVLKCTHIYIDSLIHKLSDTLIAEDGREVYDRYSDKEYFNDLSKLLYKIGNYIHENQNSGTRNRN